MNGETIRGSPRVVIGGAQYNIGGSKRFIYNNDSEQPNKWSFPTNYQYYTVVEGYRLVSASIMIRYIGKNINKAGYIMSIPTYRPLPVVSTLGLNGPTKTGSFISDKYTAFDESVFVNTRGTKTTFTLNKNMTMKRVYIPIDPADQIFEDPGYYYSSAVNSLQSDEEFEDWQKAINTGRYAAFEGSSATSSKYVRFLTPEDGNPLKYMFLGKSFSNTEGETNMHVEAYYNFECIPAEGIRIPNNNVGIKEKIANTVKQEIINKVGEHISQGNEMNVSANNIVNEIKGAITGFTSNFDTTGIETIPIKITNDRGTFKKNIDQWTGLTYKGKPINLTAGKMFIKENWRPFSEVQYV